MSILASERRFWRASFCGMYCGVIEKEVAKKNKKKTCRLLHFMAEMTVGQVFKRLDEVAQPESTKYTLYFAGGDLNAGYSIIHTSYTNIIHYRMGLTNAGNNSTKRVAGHVFFYLFFYKLILLVNF